MKKDFSKLFLPLGLAAVALTASGVDVKHFPGLRPPGDREEQASDPMRAPLNTFRGMGTQIFGVTMYDYNNYSNFLNFWSEAPSRLNKLEPVYTVGDTKEEEYPYLYEMNAGAWAGDAYYGFRVNRYSMGITKVNGWIKVDTETGKWQTLKPLLDTPDASAWNYIYDMAWNPVDDKLYALAENTDGTVTSLVGVLDRATGDWKETVTALPEYYFAMAFDYDGKVYAIRWDYDNDFYVVGTVLDVYDEDWELETSTPIRVDGRDFKSYYQHGLIFDYSTGDLWWTATNMEGNQYLVNIDPGTGKTVNKGTIGFNETIIGLHIPYVTADARTAPARVENLNYSVDHNGENKVTLTWTNPSKQWNRFTLKNLAEVRVYRDSYDGEPVAILPADASQIGKEMTWTDENATRGKHTYYVTACAEAGVKGIVDSIDAFAGRDLPGVVRNLTASTTDGKSIHLTWDAPAVGDSDGWFDSSALTYKVTRMPDGKDFGTTSATSLDDRDIPEAHAYCYLVSAVNSDGTGEAVQSNAVIAGECVLVPFKTAFETKIDADRFTSIDNNMDGRTFDYDINLNLLRNTIHMDVSSYGNDDYLVSPPLSLEKGKTYKVVYQFGFGASASSDDILTHHFRFTGGNAATAEGQSDVLGDLPAFETLGLSGSYEIVNYFTAKETGEYYVGFNVLTVPETIMWYYIEGFEISEAPDDDLAAEALDTYRYVSTIADNKFNVTVYNNGNNPQSDYKVQVVSTTSAGARQVVAETTDVPALQAHERATVSLAGHGTVLGNINYSAVVVLANDGNASNDESPAVEVVAEETDPFNVTVTNGREDLSTRNPMCHNYACSGVQTIYTPKMTGVQAADGSKVTVTRLAWEYEGKDSFNGTNVKVWLSTTDKEGYGEGDSFIAVSGEPYYDGTVRVEKGQNKYMVLDLDEPFTFNPAQNLVVTVAKSEYNHADWLTIFRVFDNDWYLDKFHSIFSGGTEEFDATAANTGMCYPEAAVLHMAIEGLGSSTEMVFAEGGTVYYDVNAGVLRCNGCTLAGVTVYDFAGNMIDNLRCAEGQSEAALGLQQGAYIIKANLATGRPVALKVLVGR